MGGLQYSAPIPNCHGGQREAARRRTTVPILLGAALLVGLAWRLRRNGSRDAAVENDQ
jgi:hypothetical protein